MRKCVIVVIENNSKLCATCVLQLPCFTRRYGEKTFILKENIEKRGY